MTTETIWNEEAEMMSRRELERLQEERLLEQVEHFATSAQFYADKFDDLDLSVKDITSTEDLQAHLPLTRKDDLRDELLADPRTLGGLATSPDDITQYFSSTGTTGTPTFYGTDDEGLEAVTEMLARIFTAMGVEEGDLVQVCTSPHHIATQVMTEALQMIGARRAGSMVHIEEISRLTHHLQHLNPDAAYAPQAFWPIVERELADQGIAPSDLSLDSVLTAGEVMVPGRSEWVEQKFATNHYDMLSMGENNQFFHQTWCTHGAEGSKRGYHVNEDYLFVEIVDPETDEPVPQGERGEITVTNLVGKAVGALRWGTEDIGYLEPEECPCGRTFNRLHVLGRDKYEVVIEGQSVFPSEVEAVLWDVDGTGEPPSYQVIKEGTVMEELVVEVQPETDGDVIESSHEALETQLGVPTTVRELDESKVQQSAYKVPVIREE